MALTPWPTAPTVTDAVRQFHHLIYLRMGRRLTSWGVYDCRFIAGTTTWSQHAWGNAEDYHGTTDAMDDLAAYARSPALRPYVSQVLWRVPDHFDHVHLSGRPLETGTPACAGGVPSGHGGHAGVFRPPLPSGADAVAGESWAPVARTAYRELTVVAGKIGREVSRARAIIGEG